jgi:hypothetical protein
MHVSFYFICLLAINYINMMSVILSETAMWKYLSVSGSEYCWANSTEERKAALIGMTATNDKAESVLGGTNANIQRYGRINLSNAAAISDAKRNKYFARPHSPPQI